MEKVNSLEDLMENISNMSRDNSVYQFHIPGKGKFTLVLQEEEQRSIQADVEASLELKAMIEQSRKEFKLGKAMSTSELLNSLSPENFRS
ncbi:hypothetical protein A7K91_11300 [Paenibacillus oryzae]|uniref:Uncharacterized protein n=1 Tax=Paenibacillus oryzae TaxID=1844972 RepID=A0A1A5YEG4_9BACL|nr:hypothetical protein [Paenibacillus oryzae]OBR63974.1 hypothetical protein A7K91_11300 [Paenibacillus oryzae]